ncbi:hypothetical protein [uncultured Paludibaculum sp.]|uniref:hypothetical protein n=1 Tax=uncultured Paludibaculum sp. TaxID=1765020 RepID=UPI002AAA7074|nr:hypothetical protein [uncultured Paludibaculum sp.]
MKRLAGVMTVLVLGAATAFAQASGSSTEQARKAAKVKSTARRAPAAASSELPANAEKIQEGVYKAKDAKGKTWIYSRTPFGWTKTDEAAFQEAAKSSEMPPIRVVAVEGDKVKFERDSPFGKSVWSKPINDLAADERAAYELKLNAKNEK